MVRVTILTLKMMGEILRVGELTSLAKMLNLREVHIWYADLKDGRIRLIGN